MSKSSDNHKSVLLSPIARSSSSSPVPRPSHKLSEGKCFEVKKGGKALIGPLVVEAVEDKGKKTSQSLPAASLPLIFRSSPTLPPLNTRNPSRDSSPSSRTGPPPHPTVFHVEHGAFPRKSKEHGHDCPPARPYFPPWYSHPLGYPHAHSSSERHYSSLSRIHTHPEEYYSIHMPTDRYYNAPLHPYYDLEDYYPPPSPFPAHVYARGKEVYHRIPQPSRPRLHIHPYAFPWSNEGDVRFYSGEGKGNGSQPSHGLGQGPVEGSSDRKLSKGTLSSPASATSTSAATVMSFKSPRKRSECNNAE